MGALALDEIASIISLLYPLSDAPRSEPTSRAAGLDAGADRSAYVLILAPLNRRASCGAARPARTGGHG